MKTEHVRTSKVEWKEYKWSVDTLERDGFTFYRVWQGRKLVFSTLPEESLPASAIVTGSKGDEYRICEDSRFPLGFSCTCPQFVFRGMETCKHIHAHKGS